MKTMTRMMIVAISERRVKHVQSNYEEKHAW